MTRHTYLRRRLLVTVLLLAVVLTVVLAVHHLSSHRSLHGLGSAAPLQQGLSTTTTITTTTTTAPAIRGLAVTRAVLPLVDTTRPVTSHGEVLSPARQLTTQLWTPVGAGPYPLVVFVAGYDKGPLDYERFCAALAASGYVVAAPSFPLEDPAQGYPLDRTELPEEAVDVSFVVDKIEQQSPVLHVDPGRVAVVGHSDGADVALLVAYGATTRDPRVTSAVADAPDPMDGPTAPSRVPLLLVQGTEDSVVPYSASQTVFGQVRAPITYLSLVGADHFAPIAGGTPWTPVLDGAVAGFLDATLSVRGGGMSALVAGLSSSPLAEVETKS